MPQGKNNIFWGLKEMKRIEKLPIVLNVRKKKRMRMSRLLSSFYSVGLFLKSRMVGESVTSFGL